MQEVLHANTYLQVQQNLITVVFQPELLLEGQAGFRVHGVEPTIGVGLQNDRHRGCVGLQRSRAVMVRMQPVHKIVTRTKRALK